MKLRKTIEYLQALSGANVWLFTYFQLLKGNSLDYIPSNSLVNTVDKKNFSENDKKLMDKINKIAKKHQFFHWYVEFPEVFSTERGGFDCILTNQPWDILKLKEMEFFLGLDDKILATHNNSERKKLIKSLKKNKHNLLNNSEIL